MGHSNRSRVPLTAKQEREIEQLGRWVEPNAWTHRMLTALVTGVKGGVCNAYFERHGLVSLTAAHDQLRQSSRR